MHIERQRFLVLASALLVGSCGSDSDDTSTGDGGSEGTGGTSASGGSGGSTGGSGGTMATGGTAGVAGTGGGAAGTGGGVAGSGGDAGSGGNAGAGGVAGTGGGTGGSTGGSAGTGGQSGTGGTAGAGGATCDDSVGSPGDCNAIPSTCGPWAVQYCESMKTYLKPRVAENAVSCMLGITDCINPNPYECVFDALVDACTDSGADYACTDIVDYCFTTYPTDMQECRDLLSGMNDDGRTEVWFCAVSGCDFGLWSCIESL